MHKFILLNCHSFQLIGKIMIHKKIKYIPEWIFFSINRTVFLFQSSSPFHITLPWINTNEISCWISLPSYHTIISVKNKKRSNYPLCRKLANQAELHKNTTPGNRHKKKFLKCHMSPKIHQRYQSLISRSCKAGEYSVPWKRGHSFNLPHTHWITLWRHL